MAELGCPTKYSPDILSHVVNYCRLGATDEQLAEFLNVSVATIYNWKNNFPDFLEATKRGKRIADQEIENALFHRAKGYTHDDVDIRAVARGNNEGSEIVQTPVKKHYPPDPVSMIFWLKNRQPDKWRDVNRSEILMAKIEVTGSSAKEIDEELKKRAITLPE